MNLTKRNILLPRDGQINDLYDLPTAISRIVEIKVLSAIQSAIHEYGTLMQNRLQYISMVN